MTLLPHPGGEPATSVSRSAHACTEPSPLDCIVFVYVYLRYTVIIDMYTLSKKNRDKFKRLYLLHGLSNFLIFGSHQLGMRENRPAKFQAIWLS